MEKQEYYGMGVLNWEDCHIPLRNYHGGSIPLVRSTMNGVRGFLSICGMSHVRSTLNGLLGFLQVCGIFICNIKKSI